MHWGFFPCFFEICVPAPVKSVKQKGTYRFEKTCMNVAGAAVSPSDFTVVDPKVWNVSARSVQYGVAEVATLTAFAVFF